MGIPPKADPEKNCEACGAPLLRRRFGKRLEDRGVFLRRRHCSQACANSRKDVATNTGNWRARRAREMSCQQCGTTQGLHVHHKDRDPLNNDPSNLMTLCASCHLRLHWQQDRDRRMEAARRGALTRKQSGAGS